MIASEQRIFVNDYSLTYLVHLVNQRPYPMAWIPDLPESCNFRCSHNLFWFVIPGFKHVFEEKCLANVILECLWNNFFMDWPVRSWWVEENEFAVHTETYRCPQGLSWLFSLLIIPSPHCLSNGNANMWCAPSLILQYLSFEFGVCMVTVYSI